MLCGALRCIVRLFLASATPTVDLLHSSYARAGTFAPFGMWPPPAHSCGPSVLRPHSCLLTPLPFSLRNVLTTTSVGSIRWLLHGRREPFGCSERAPMPIQSQPSSRLRSRPISQFARTHIAHTTTARLRARSSGRADLAMARSIRDIISQRWLLTEKMYEQKNPKGVYYLSMEFLLGAYSLTASSMRNCWRSPWTS